MGKIKRLRNKLHITAKTERSIPCKNTNSDNYGPDATLPLPDSDLFAGFNIDVDTLKIEPMEDAQSIKSSKSMKFDKSKQVIIPKKEKLKMRRDILLRKIDTVNQMKRDLKLRKKRKSTAIFGDTNPLHDALPSLESLVKSRSIIKQQTAESKKKKGIEKAKKRKREGIQGMKIFKSVLDNKTFQKDPLGAVTQHIQALVSQEKMKLKK